MTTLTEYHLACKHLSTYTGRFITPSQLDLWEHPDPTEDYWLAHIEGHDDNYFMTIPKWDTPDAWEAIMEGEHETPIRFRRLARPGLRYQVAIDDTILAEPTIRELCRRLRQYIVDNDYGASDVGSRFTTMEMGKFIGFITYSGNFISKES